MNRRSFLQALAAAVALDPTKLLAKAAPLIEAGMGDYQAERFIIPQPDRALWMPYQFVETIVIPRGIEMMENFGLPPLPSNFLIHRLYTHLDTEAVLDDWIAALEGVSLRMQADGKTYLESPIALLNYGFGLHGAEYIPTPIHPPLRPQKDFKISLAASRLNLDAEQVRVHVVVDGAVQVTVE